jgi:hypothetical protein
LQGFLLQVEVSEIIVHEAGEPNAVIDLLDAEFLAGAPWSRCIESPRGTFKSMRSSQPSTARGGASQAVDPLIVIKERTEAIALLADHGMLPGKEDVLEAVEHLAEEKRCSRRLRPSNHVARSTLRADAPCRAC